jgi:hypothetical protein
MFDFLPRVPSPAVAEGAYEAAPRMFVRTRPEDVGRTAKVPPPTRASSDADLAAGILSVIERIEPKPRPELSDDEVQRYTARLLEMVQERFRAGTRSVPRKAQALLEDMRLSNAR